MKKQTTDTATNLAFESIVDAEKELNEATAKVDKQATPKQTEFPAGAFDDDEENIPIENSEGKKTDTKPADSSTPDASVKTGGSITVTYMIDAVVGFIGILFFGGKEELCLSPTEIGYYEDMERRCGVTININSPIFFWCMISIAYAGKVVVLIRFKMEEKKAEKAGEALEAKVISSKVNKK